MTRTALACLLLLSCAHHGARPDVTACEQCLATGLKWTGGQCMDTCLQDTYCFGPGTHAPQCPQSGGVD